ncbi:hypothetical protein BDV18DRAFT_137636 [Aspergillus unguis]
MMRKWQAARSAHCVIAPRPSSSPKAPPAATQQLRYSTNLQSTQNQIRTPYLKNHSKPTPSIKYPSSVFPARSLTTTRTMSSDDAYMSFLDKANSDLDAGRANQATTSSTSGAKTETVDVNVKVPAPLTSVDAYYVSDADEPFEPVALRWKGAERGSWPDAASFSKLISPDADLSSSIETLSTSSFDPKNQYASVIKAVRAAAVEGGSGDESAVEVKVYRVETGSSRAEYWVVALGQESVIVGLRAKAIES